MSLNSKDRKKLARKKNLDEIEIQALEGFTHFVVGQVRKYGQLKVQTDEDLVWLKKAQERVLDNAQEIRVKRLPQKIAGDGENPIRLVIELPEADGK